MLGMDFDKGGCLAFVGLVVVVVLVGGGILGFRAVQSWGDQAAAARASAEAARVRAAGEADALRIQADGERSLARADADSTRLTAALPWVVLVVVLGILALAGGWVFGLMWQSRPVPGRPVVLVLTDSRGSMNRQFFEAVTRMVDLEDIEGLRYVAEESRHLLEEAR